MAAAPKQAGVAARGRNELAFSFFCGFFCGLLQAGSGPSLRRRHLHHAPLWILRALYGGMIYVEVVLPFCGFFSGAPRCFGAWGLILLMFGIFLTGNWGQFNIGHSA